VPDHLRRQVDAGHVEAQPGEVGGDRARAAAHIKDRPEPAHGLGEGGQPCSQPRLLREVSDAEIDVRSGDPVVRGPDELEIDRLLHAGEASAPRTALPLRRAGSAERAAERVVSLRDEPIRQPAVLRR
jgi:hypothetical protein